MKPISSSDLPGYKFKAGEEKSYKLRAQTNKIGWIHSFADSPKTRFDLVIKDALGREKYRKENCGGSERSGDLANLEVSLGEELEVFATNIRGGQSVEIFLN